MKVFFKDKTIQDIKVLEHFETSGIAYAALKLIPENIIQNQSLMIDTISGCTITSAALISGVQMAIEKAGLQIQNYYKEPNITSSDEVIKKNGGCHRYRRWFGRSVCRRYCDRAGAALSLSSKKCPNAAVTLYEAEER